MQCLALQFTTVTVGIYGVGGIKWDCLVSECGDYSEIGSHGQCWCECTNTVTGESSPPPNGGWIGYDCAMFTQEDGEYCRDDMCRPYCDNLNPQGPVGGYNKGGKIRRKKPRRGRRR